MSVSRQSLLKPTYPHFVLCFFFGTYWKTEWFHKFQRKQQQKNRKRLQESDLGTSLIQPECWSKAEKSSFVLLNPPEKCVLFLPGTPKFAAVFQMDGCLVISSHFLCKRFGIIQLKQPLVNSSLGFQVLFFAAYGLAPCFCTQGVLTTKMSTCLVGDPYTLPKINIAPQKLPSQ